MQEGWTRKNPYFFPWGPENSTKDSKILGANSLSLHKEHLPKAHVSHTDTKADRGRGTDLAAHGRPETAQDVRGQPRPSPLGVREQPRGC